LAPEVRDDLARILDHLLGHHAEQASSRMREIMQAIDVLGTNPLIGRPAVRDKRELVIGRGSHGYVALYRYVVAIDTVFVLALRGQREAGYRRR
jgi:plasmid stabilization system protein ParE